ncbi:MAG: class I SAM-dependent methyltransferase [Coriobacteriia bacterium]|nr:class I SAM-dependent methyltransferase [Coriobacteriia bacterium]
MPAENDVLKPAPASDYDEFVNWNARLARELPFFRRVFDEVGARSVIDVGAGSARHSIEFAAWGMSVDAIDPTDSMLSQAEANIATAAERIAEAGGELRLTRGGFGGLQALGLGGADALICTGNALPHVGGRVKLRGALADFAAVLRPGGVLVLHLLNHARLYASKPRAIPPVVRDTPAGTRVFLRVISYPEGDEYLDFDFLTLTRDAGGEWTTTSRRSAHTALPVDLLREELTAAGFEHVEAFGGHDGHALAIEHDESVIVVARRG